MPVPSAIWWGQRRIPIGRTVNFCIGPLVLYVSRLPHEWRVTWEPAGRSSDMGIRIEWSETPPIDVNTAVKRYATVSNTEQLRITPVLPDRSVVTSPERPITILPHTEIVLFVGSPVWIKLFEGDDSELGELPALPPKETWIGPNTREGELCYATRTRGRLSIGEVPVLPHRVMTAVTIRNTTPVPFVLSQVNLPVRRLSVYSSDEGRLWTESILLEHSSATDLAKLTVASSPPPEADRPELVSRPRHSEDTGFFRAFGTLFGAGT